MKTALIPVFRKLEEKEKEACFDQLVDIYKNGRENTNDIDLPFTRNKKWDLEEWIVLVKVYFEHKDKSRSELNELLSPLSSMLVRRADALGIEHDEKYRNINGLAMQFDRIKYMDTKGAKGLSAYSELAEAALEMCHTDREGFELLAKNAGINMEQIERLPELCKPSERLLGEQGLEKAAESKKSADRNDERPRSIG